MPGKIPTWMLLCGTSRAWVRTGKACAAKWEKHPQLLDIDKVLRLIDECEGDKDACEKRIRESVSPDVYTRLLNEMYGPLRRNEYKIEYSVRSFNLEEAKKQIKTRPDLLSVEEIYTVAESYGKGTADYEEALRIAAATYPKNAAAVVNAACLKMEGRDVQGSYRDAGGFGGERGRQGAERAGCGVCQAEAVRPCKGGAGASSAGRKPGSTHQPGAGGRRSGRLVRKTEQIHKTNIFTNTLNYEVKQIFMLGLVGLAFAACGNEDEAENALAQGNGAVSIKIVSPTANSRAVTSGLSGWYNKSNRSCYGVFNCYF